MFSKLSIILLAIKQVSTTRNILNQLNQNTEQFQNQFGFYLDFFDKILEYQSQIGFSDLTKIEKTEQTLCKTYLFIVESSNTSAISALSLFSSGVISDTYSILRILYETLALLKYGNISRQSKLEIHTTLFQSGLKSPEHQKNEWKLIQKSVRHLESEKPGFIEVRKELNNFGSHLSGRKIIIGNITVENKKSVSRIFTQNFNDSWFLAGLDFLIGLVIAILHEYTDHLDEYGAVPKKLRENINELPNQFLNNVRPRLQKMEK